MKPNLPLSWIGTTTRARDQGLFHLEAFVINRGPLGMSGVASVRAACGTRPFAYAGSFPDGSPTVSPGSRCQKCEAMAKNLRSPALCECPGCDHHILLAERDSLVDPDMPCPKCHTFRLGAFVLVPR